MFLSRYLAQVIIDFPKPIVAALKKPAQGLGAKLVSLCDLVCDEVSNYILIIGGANGLHVCTCTSNVNSRLYDLE